MDLQQLALVQTDPGITPEQLDVILPPLEDLLNNSIDADYQSERVLQLLRLQVADAYDRGIQNIAPNLETDGTVQLTTYGNGNAGGVETNQGINARSLDYNPRKTRSYRDKFVAVLGQRPFYNTNAEAKDPTSETDRRAARQVNLLIQMLHNQWSMREINNRLFYYLFTFGTVLGHQRPVTDGKKLGTHQVPNIVPQQQCMDGNCGQLSPMSPPDPTKAQGQPGPCPSCGAPTVVVPTHQGFNEYPNTSVEPTLLNGMFWTVPFNVEDPESTPWLRTEGEKDKGICMAAWPNARTLVGPTAGGNIGGSASDATGAVVRASSQSQMGITRSQRNELWSDQRTWLKASQFEKLNDENVRNLCKQLFPHGCKIVRLENKTVAIHAEQLTDVMCSCLPSMSTYLFADGTSWGIFPMDDLSTNLLNILADTFESAIARYILNPDFFNVDSMNTLRYSPTRYISALPKTGEGFSNAFSIMPTSDPSPAMPDFVNVVESIIQNITGMLPQVFGDMPSGLTLGQARMMLTQGLMQLGTIADNALHFYEELDTNGVNLYLKVATVNPSLNGEQIDLDLIRMGNWTIKGGTVMPRTFSERAQALQEMLQQPNGQQLAQQLKVFDPVNYAALTAYLDLPDLKNPDLDAMESLSDIIDQLWQGQPIIQPPQPAPIDPMTGMPSGPPPPPPPPQPSIDFDGMVYDPQMVISLCRASLTNRAGVQRKNTPGAQNVRAFLQQAIQAATPPPPKPEIPKLSISAQLKDFSPAQQAALLQDYSLDAPFLSEPTIATTSRIEEQAHLHQMGDKAPHPLALQPPPLQPPDMVGAPSPNGNPLLSPNPMPPGVM
jgi:hypothetical protein